MSIVKEFREFAVKGNVIDLAVGVIIGAAFGKIVASLVEDVVMPVIGTLIGGVDFSGLAVQIGAAKIQYGKFLQTCLDFLIIAWAIFLTVKLINRLKREEPKPRRAAAAAAGAAAGGDPRPAEEELGAILKSPGLQHRELLRVDVPAQRGVHLAGVSAAMRFSNSMSQAKVRSRTGSSPAGRRARGPACAPGGAPRAAPSCAASTSAALKPSRSARASSSRIACSTRARFCGAKIAETPNAADVVERARR